MPKGRNASPRAKIIAALRTTWFRYDPNRRLVLKQSSAFKGSVYMCSHCSQFYPKKGVHVDHIIPVISPYEPFCWDSVIARLFCNPEGLQVLCKFCHQKKTNQERSDRNRAADSRPSQDTAVKRPKSRRARQRSARSDRANIVQSPARGADERGCNPKN